MDYSLPGSCVHGDSPGKNTGVSCHFLLQGIFPTQGSKPGLPHCRQIPYHLSHQGSPTHNKVIHSQTPGIKTRSLGGIIFDHLIKGQLDSQVDMLGMCRFCIIHPTAILACFQILFKIRNMLIGKYSALLLHIF